MHPLKIKFVKVHHGHFMQPVISCVILLGFLSCVLSSEHITGAQFAPRKYAKGTRSAGRLAFIFYKQAAPWIPRSLLGISDFKSLGLGGEVGEKTINCILANGYIVK